MFWVMGRRSLEWASSYRAGRTGALEAVVWLSRSRVPNTRPMCFFLNQTGVNSLDGRRCLSLEIRAHGMDLKRWLNESDSAFRAHRLSAISKVQMPQNADSHKRRGRPIVVEGVKDEEWVNALNAIPSDVFKKTTGCGLGNAGLALTLGGWSPARRL